MTLSEQMAFVWDIATGAKRTELERMRQNLVSLKYEIDEKTPAVQAQPPGEARNQLQLLQEKMWAGYMKQVQDFNLAAEAHNQISAEITKRSGGLYNPGKVNMTLRVLPALAWIAGVAVGSAAIIYSLSALIDSIKSKNTEVRGYMDQFAGILQQGGGVIEKGGAAVAKLTWSLVAVAGVAAVFIAFKTWKDAGMPGFGTMKARAAA